MGEMTMIIEDGETTMIIEDWRDGDEYSMALDLSHFNLRRHQLLSGKGSGLFFIRWVMSSSPLNSPSSDNSDSWKICSPGDNPEHVKTKLRHWAQAVACSVMQSY
ncbi:unnamed protein product [Cuscuta campestris]|uniref:Uncharacterized protein n=1 Tax=Cuscuta campestris TaxID=132261 RepID=A0A484LIY4_9ASTE|nr:unnamed protein product [Cuscuta campestris]